MKTFKVTVLAILLKNNKIAKHGEFVKEDELSTDAEKLIEDGYISKLTKADIAEQEKGEKDAIKAQKEADEAAKKAKEDAQKASDEAAKKAKESEDAQKAEADAKAKELESQNASKEGNKQ